MVVKLQLSISQRSIIHTLNVKIEDITPQITSVTCKNTTTLIQLQFQKVYFISRFYQRQLKVIALSNKQENIKQDVPRIAQVVAESALKVKQEIERVQSKCVTLLEETKKVSQVREEVLQWMVKTKMQIE
ncbi:Hypothetical_protein [Hexamita inflata]|uniref:Hypothetical_protein n=1 Tax=Hexamita inflata TaxID=28002 RepID=A0AA86QQG9_9EUKA|nr:Hypothetical protein HINF_LOCUS44919 [Hexamita inflata]